MDKSDQKLTQTIRVLIVEDSADDALFLARQLKRDGYNLISECVDTANNFRAALDKSNWDIIISDFVLPEFSGLETLQILHDRGLDTPCIIVSGKITDETAVSAMKAGARDFISKNNLSRLGPVIEREMAEAEIRRKQKLTERALEENEQLRTILLNNAPNPITLTNPDTSIIYVNPAFERLTGFTLSELKGKKTPFPWYPDDWEQLFHDQDENRRGRGLNRLDRCYQKKNGELIWVSLSITSIEVEGKIKYHVAGWLDITERRKFTNELELLNHKIITAQEDERKRIVRELHEGTVQLLAIIQLELEALSRSNALQSAESRDKLKHLQENTNHAMQDIRSFSYALRPGELDHLGLDIALEQLAEDNNEREKFITEFQVTGESRRLAGDVELVLFRIVQEALSNIEKHSHAAAAVIKMEYLPERVRLVIEDNGQGFNPEKESDNALNDGRLGLIGMRERAHLINADLKIESGIGKGTIISVDLKTTA